LINKVARYFTRRVLDSKGMRLCPLCDDAVIGNQEHACMICTLDATFGIEVKV
jgi:hypothetical protein